MSAGTSLSLSQGFTRPGIQSLTYKDDFCSFAGDLREELLRYPNWKAMTQEGMDGRVFAPHRQNGITTGHLDERDCEHLRYCCRFSELLNRNLGALCPLVGADPAKALSLEINAMAYGGGGWLSPHTDSIEYSHSESRLVAWMLYLTAPEDGEWPAEKGGAVRVWTPGGEEQRVRPRFNRFAMFRVHRDSFHEIEKVTWDPVWSRCRLALSGWIAGRAVPEAERNTRMYLLSSAADENNAQAEARFQGMLALERLLAAQKAYGGADTGATMGRISVLEQDYQAHRDAPPGTSFLRRVQGPAGLIIVVNEGGDVLHFGRPEAYRPKAAASGSR